MLRPKASERKKTRLGRLQTNREEKKGEGVFGEKYSGITEKTREEGFVVYAVTEEGKRGIWALKEGREL